MRCMYPNEFSELNKIKDDFKKKPTSKISGHVHKWERIFIFNPGGGLLNARVFDVCKGCGENKNVDITPEMSKDISHLINEKNR